MITIFRSIMDYDLLIVGSGPIGIEVAAAARGQRLRELLVDRGQLAQTVVDWPVGSRFFSSPERMAVAGVPLQTTHQELAPREEYLAYLRNVVEVRGLEPRLNWTVAAVRRRGTTTETANEGFTVDLVHSLYPERRESVTAKCVVVTTGDMATANLLGIPGEGLPHVSHYVGDPHRYFKQRLLVVGGRNSAVETAIRAWRLGAQVAISYRRRAFEERYVYSRLHLEINLLTAKGAIAFYPGTVPVRITPDAVELARAGDSDDGRKGATVEVPADFVFLATGYNAENALLAETGVRLSDPDSVPEHDRETMETNVPGLFVAGTAAAGNQREYQAFVGTSHDHAGKILKRAFGIDPEATAAWTGSVAGRHYAFGWKDIEPE